MRKFLPAWKKIPLVPTILLGILAAGLKLDFDPDMGTPQPIWQKNHGSVFADLPFVREAIEAGLEQQVMVECKREELLMIMPLGIAVHSRTLKKRLIFDARWLNQYIKARKFKLDQLSEAGRFVFAGQNYGYAADISSAYFHIEFHPSAFPYLGFEFEGKFYCYRCLAFGYANAPYWFEMLMRPVKSQLHREGARLLSYLDDIIGAASSAEQQMADIGRVLQLLEELGFVVNKQKSIGLFEPVQRLEALGTVVDLIQQKFIVPSQKIERIIAGCKKLLSATTPIHAKRIAQTKGLIALSYLALGSATRIFTRSMDILIDSRLAKGEAATMSSHELRQSWNRKIWMNDATRFELNWWVKHLPRMSGMPIESLHARLPIDAYVFSDASWSGWGAFCIPTWAAGFCQPAENDQILINVRELLADLESHEERVAFAREGFMAYGGFNTEQANKSSTYRELLAVLCILQLLAKILKGCRVRLQLDSQAGTFALGGKVPNHESKVHGGSRIAEIQELVVKIWLLCEEAWISLSVVWSGREENLLADHLSHGTEIDHYNYTLRPDIMKRLHRSHGQFSIDRFASDQNNVVKRFNSQFFCKGTQGVDAFSFHWGAENENNWIFPPFPAMGNVIMHVIRCRARGTLICPQYEAQPWWSLISPRYREWAPFVSHAECLGLSDNILQYPPSNHVAKADLHLPRGVRIWALKIRFLPAGLGVAAPIPTGGLQAITKGRLAIGALAAPRGPATSASYAEMIRAHTQRDTQAPAVPKAFSSEWMKECVYKRSNQVNNIWDTIGAEIRAEREAKRPRLEASLPIPTAQRAKDSTSDELALAFQPAVALRAVSENTLATSTQTNATVAAMEIARFHGTRKNTMLEAQLSPELEEIFMHEVRAVFEEDGELVTPEMLEIARGMRATSTISKHTIYFRLWKEYCKRNNLAAIPADKYALATYIQLMAVGNESFSPTQNRANAIKFFHTLRGKGNPFTGPAEWSLHFLDRKLSRPATQKLPLLASHMLQLYSKYVSVQEPALEDLVMYLGVRLSWEGLLRFSDLQCANYDCILITHEYMRVFIFHTKNNNSGKWITIPTSRQPESAFQSMLRCIDAMRSRWRKFRAGIRHKVYEEKFGAEEASKLSAEEKMVLPLKGVFLLCPCDSLAESNTRPAQFLTAQCAYTKYRAKLKTWLRDIDLPEEYYGTHSARIGGRSTLALIAAARETAKNQGHWKSDAVQERYISDAIRLPSVLEDLRRFVEKGTYAYASVEENQGRKAKP